MCAKVCEGASATTETKESQLKQREKLQEIRRNVRRSRASVINNALSIIGCILFIHKCHMLHRNVVAAGSCLLAAVGGGGERELSTRKYISYFIDNISNFSPQRKEHDGIYSASNE